jgi:glutathione peroxidase
MIVQLLILIFSAGLNSGIYEFKVKDFDDKIVNFSDFKGKKIMIVNVASNCGYTKQYTDLQKLHKEYGDKVVLIGMPCNDFGGQEPGTVEEIKEFCEANYGITFTITEKVGIKKDKHPLYQWLTEKSKNGVGDFDVKWNFHKFLIDEKGNLVKSLPSSVKPMDDEIISWVKG